MLKKCISLLNFTFPENKERNDLEKQYALSSKKCIAKDYLFDVFVEVIVYMFVLIVNCYI